MFKTIIVPVDLSHTEQADTMLATAKQLGGDDVHVILLNVVEDIPKHASVDMPVGFADKCKQSAEETLGTIAKASGMNANVVVRVGKPHATILGVANEKNADMIIVTSHQPGMQDYLLGSTAAKIVRHAKCSVVVLR